MRIRMATTTTIAVASCHPAAVPAAALIEQNKAAGRLLPRNGCWLKGYGIRRRPGCLAAQRSGAVPPYGVPMTSLPGELPAAGT
jgi:hypothetical protein